jgi:hypothetical protein
MGAQRTCGERRREEGGGSDRPLKVGSGSVALSRKTEAGEAHTRGVQYDMGRMSRLLLAGLKE